MNQQQVKKLIVKWVEIEEQLRKVKEEHKEINKKFKAKKLDLMNKQNQIKDPILQLMTDIDTETININDNLTIKSKQICKTIGVTKDYMKQRIEEYFKENSNTYKTIIMDFTKQYNINISDKELSTYISQFNTNEVETLYEYITDITPRKIFHDEEKLSLTKRKKKK